MSISIRIPAELKQRLVRLVTHKETNAHAFMLEAISEKVDAEELQLEFHAEARRRLATMKKSGKGIQADLVFEYLHSRARGARAKRPRTPIPPSAVPMIP